MTIQEQANEILARTTTDTDELLLRLVQDRKALLAALKPVVTHRAGGSWHHLTGENAQAALAAIEQAERP